MPRSIVIGGGFFGCRVALWLRAQGHEVVLFEATDALMTRASYVNQARIHTGYHYPRSILTALRSRVNEPVFKAEYPECVVDHFQMYYAIARARSAVTARQFQTLCERIEAPCEPATGPIAEAFDPEHVEAVFAVEEHAFDATRLATRVAEELDAAGVIVELGAKVTGITAADGGLTVHAPDATAADYVFNCTYADLNALLAAPLTPVPLKHELTEMALVRMPPALEHVAITVMCGPFFSVMPFPPRGLHTLSHVRYTPHCWWSSGDRPSDLPARPSHFPHMIRDASRFFPALADATHVDSLWAVKTVLPRNERDDGRPILFWRDPAHAGLVSILGGKIDNVYDLPRELSRVVATR